MMELFLPLTLIWALCSTAQAIDCLQCQDASCLSATATPCPPGQMCLTAFQTALLSTGANFLFTTSACALPSFCPTAGSRAFSFTSPTFHATVDVVCCDTDGCNTATQPFPELPALNGQMCCANSECNNEVQCRGTETNCFLDPNGARGNGVGGCASSEVCELGSLFIVPTLAPELVVMCPEPTTMTSPTTSPTAPTKSPTAPTKSPTAPTKSPTGSSCCGQTNRRRYNNHRCCNINRRCPNYIYYFP